MAQTTNPTPAARPARARGEESGSQASRDKTKVGDEHRRDPAQEARLQKIREQTRPRDPDEVKPREVSENRDPDQRDERPGHEERSKGGRLQVQALKDLWYQNRSIRAGEVFTLQDGLTPQQRKDHDFGNATSNAQADPEALPDPGEPPSVPPPSLANRQTL